jgi:hypothetical protein
MPPSVDFEVVQDNSHVLVAVWKDVLISIWRTDVEVADVRHTEPAQASLLQRYPRFGSLAIVERGALRMSAPARQEAARISKIGEQHCIGVALIVGIQGFGGAAVRAAITAVHMLSGAKVPQRSFSEVPAAAKWLLAQCGHEATEFEMLASVVQGFRSAT